MAKLHIGSRGHESASPGLYIRSTENFWRIGSKLEQRHVWRDWWSCLSYDPNNKVKTNQSGKSDVISLSCSKESSMLNECDCVLCPAHGLQDLFSGVRRSPSFSIEDPVFQRTKGGRLTYGEVLRFTKESPREFTSETVGTHSFRRSGAQWLFKGGVDLQIIKRVGRWKSDAVFDYLRECQVPLTTRKNLTKVMCSA